MDNKVLTERYIYAVTRNLPAAMRSDVERELESLISDMLEERCGEGEPSEADLRAVLTELGHPQELAVRYTPDRALIPQPYYNQYLLVLRIVLAAVCGGAALALILAAALDPTESFMSLHTDAVPAGKLFGKLLAEVFAGVFSAAIQGFTWVTVIFAVMARRGVRMQKEENYLDSLPELPENRKPIGKGGAVVSIIFSAAFAVVMIAAPQVICIISSAHFTGAIPVFDPAVIRSLWPFILLIGLSGIVSGCTELMEGYRTKRLMVVNLVCNAVAAVSTIILLANSQILNPAYRRAVDLIFSGGSVPANLMQNISMLMLGCILLGLIIDSVESVWTTLRH